MAMSCGIPPFSSVNCNAPYGTCHNGTCVCAAGYSGLSDFAITSNVTDCAINTVAIQALWGINLAFCLIWVPIEIPKLYTIYQLQRQHAQTRGTKFNIRHNKSMMALMPYLILGYPTQITLAIVKMVNPDVHVGVNWLPTVLWWFVRIGLYGSLFSFQPTLVESLLQSQKSDSVQAVVRLNILLSKILFGLAISVQFMAIYSIVAPFDPFNPEPGIVAAEFLYLGSFLSLLAAGMQAIFIRNKINSLLHGATDSRALLIRSNLSVLQSQYSKSSLFQSLAGLTFGVIPILFSKHDYFLPVTTCILPFTSFRTATILLNIARSPVGQNPTSKTNSKDTTDPAAAAVVVAAARPGASTRNNDDTLFGTFTSVLVVDENAPELLAQGEGWKNIS